MDYTRCVAHHISGRYKGERCKQKATHDMFGPGSKLRVCYTHYNFYAWTYPKWVKEILSKGVMGRYNHA